jgi:hypothetical protein
MTHTQPIAIIIMGALIAAPIMLILLMRDR